MCSTAPQVRLVIVKCRKPWVFVASCLLPMPQEEFYLYVYSFVIRQRDPRYFTSNRNISVASGFSKRLAISMPSVLTAWDLNIKHWFPKESTLVSLDDFFGYWRDGYGHLTYNVLDFSDVFIVDSIYLSSRLQTHTRLSTARIASSTLLATSSCWSNLSLVLCCLWIKVIYRLHTCASI